MSKSNNLGDFLTDLANTIRTKKGTSAAINAQDFSTEISSIQTGADVSDTTATASDVLQGKDFYLANGTKTTGTIATFTPDASYTSNQTLSTQNKFVDGDIVINVSGGGSGIHIRQFTSPNGTATDNSGTYAEGATINFTSTPASGYSTIWYVDGRRKATTNNYTHTVINRDENVYCLFKKDGTEYLTFMGEDGEFSIVFTERTKTWNGTVEYSTNLSTWTTWNGDTELYSSNRMLYLRGTGNSIFIGNVSGRSISILGSKVACLGPIDALMSGTYISTLSAGDYCFKNLFYNCSNLTTAPEFTSLSIGNSSVGKYAYQYMFYNCTSLRVAPELPATAFNTYCYQYMFQGCKSLTVPPTILPATTLANYCYQYMFQDCTSLTTAPALPATTLANYCYSNMFRGCTSLTTAPALPATTLAQSCYNNMFYGCTSLIVAPELPVTTLATSCYQNMFQNCTSLTTAPALPATTLANSCYSSMFSGCTSLTTAPALPATTLADSCYSSMFISCTSLTYVHPFPVSSGSLSNAFNNTFKASHIKVSTTQDSVYNTALITGDSAYTDTFAYTAGSYTGGINANTTYYVANAITT